MLKCLYVTDDHLDVKLPMLIRLQDLWDWSNQKQTPHKQKHTVVAIKQENKKTKTQKGRRKSLEKMSQISERKVEKTFETPYKVFTHLDKQEENNKLPPNREVQIAK